MGSPTSPFSPCPSDPLRSLLDDHNGASSALVRHGLRTRRVRISEQVTRGALRRDANNAALARESPKHSLRGLDLPIIALVEKPATQLILGLNRNNHCGASIFRQHSRTEDPPDPHQRASHTCGLEQRYRSAAHIWSHRNNHNGALSAIVHTD